ncbi:tetratricopeptide repeat protein [bacterium]|nr:tetratricopeptide repeat protein [bacterium]
MKKSNPTINGLLVLTLATVLQAQALGPQQTRQMLARAAEYESLRRYDLAAEIYVRLTEVTPTDQVAYSGAKRCLLQLQQYARLEQLVLQLQTHFRRMELEADLAEITFLQGQRKEAVQRWMNLVESNPQSEQVYLLIGATLERYDLLDEARQVYVLARRRFKSPARHALEISRIAHRQGEYELSARELGAFLTAFPEQAARIQSQCLNQAAEEPAALPPMVRVLTDQIKRIPDRAAGARQILGALQIQAGKYDEALKQYLALETDGQDSARTHPPGYYLHLLGVTAMQDSAFVPAKQAFNLLLQHYSDSPYSREAELALGEIYERQKEYTAAIAAYEKFTGRQEKSQHMITALLRIADIQFRHLNDLPSARAGYERALSQAGAHRALCYYRLGEVAMAADSLSVAEGYFSRIVRELPAAAEQHRQARLALAVLDFYTGKLTSAEQRLKELLALKAGSAPSRVENDALELYWLLTENRADSIGLQKLGAGRLYLGQRQYDRAVERLLSVEGSAAAEARLTLIEAYRLSGRAEAAVPVCEALLQDNRCRTPDRVLMALAGLYESELHHPDEARKKYETLLEKYPQSIYIEEARRRVRLLDKQLNQRSLF